jgi:hypothetical protein
MEPLATDEIIEEIHAARLEHAASFDIDIDIDIERILADLKKSERIHTEQGWPLVQAQERPASDMAFQRIRFGHR